jgi:glyoxylase-like metal-dependent hydrolase (beta-lactamase superfamily II)
MLRECPPWPRGSIALFFEKEGVLFSGDAAPLPGDLPIYENLADCVSSIHKLKQIGKVDSFFSAPSTNSSEAGER